MEQPRDVKKSFKKDSQILQSNQLLTHNQLVVLVTHDINEGPPMTHF